MLARAWFRFCIFVNTTLQAVHGASCLYFLFVFSTISFLSQWSIYYSPYCSLSRFSNCCRIGESYSIVQFVTLSGFCWETSIELSLRCWNSGLVNKPVKISTLLEISWFAETFLMSCTSLSLNRSLISCVLALSLTFFLLFLLDLFLNSLVLFGPGNLELWHYCCTCSLFSSFLLVGSSFGSIWLNTEVDSLFSCCLSIFNIL